MCEASSGTWKETAGVLTGERVGEIIFEMDEPTRMCNSAIYAMHGIKTEATDWPPRVRLFKSFPFAIGGFVDAGEFAPATEEGVDTGGCDRLALSCAEFDEVASGELLRE